jgi:hypothetical protein
MTESSERIGEDVLGGAPPSRMDKRKAELMVKAKKEVEKKKKAKQMEEEDEKLAKLPIPGEKPPEMSEEEWQELQMRARLTGQLLEEEEKVKSVKVKAHKRGLPKKQEQKESFFDFP